MRSLLLFALLVLLLPAISFAQNDLPVQTPDSALQTGAKATGKHRQILVFPVAAKSIETSWSFGGAASVTFHLFKKDTVSRTSNLQALSLYSLKKQFITAVTGTQYFHHESYILYEQLSYSSFPDKFWGLGNKAPGHDEESYSFKQYYIDMHLMRNLGHNLYVGSVFELQRLLNVDYKPGGLFDKENIQGRKPYLVAGLGLSLTYDDRTNAFAPLKGTFAQVYFNHFDRYLGSDFVYTNIVVDIRKYIPIYRQQILALQLFNFTNLGDDVPLRSLASLGGNNSMRGYYDGRFRDKQQLVLQAEYRVPVIGRLGAVVFGGTGDVAHSPTGFRIDDLKYSYGGGLRFAINKSERLNLRLDYGIAGNHNSGLYFQLGEAF